MATATIVREVAVKRTTRVRQLEGLFDLPPAERSAQRWTVTLPIDEKPWRIGLIVGPSGSGKTTVARTLFGGRLVAGHDWPADGSLVDGFPAALSIKDVTGLLSSVGLSSPPTWLRPFAVLSNGEQFRATLARALAEASTEATTNGNPPLVVMDEFTSVVDRTVARIGSAAVAGAVRRRGLRFVAVSCHDDIVEWLQPDWLYQPATNAFQWRLLRRRPAIDVRVVRAGYDAWRMFKHVHYLSGSLHPAARRFLGLVDGRPALFTAVLPAPHPTRPGWREHRTVCLPDFQGVGLGNAMSEHVASLFAATGRPYRSVTSHPAMIGHRARSPLWRMTRGPGLGHRQPMAGFGRTAALTRLTASFEYVGPARRDDARRFGLLVAGR